jgi:aldehyde:ferredoxin oxidoreductase
VPTPYRGVFALVDPGRREVKRLEVPGSLYQQFIGGASIAAALFSELAASKPEPLSPENPLILATGPLTGTRAPTSGRYAVAARPPLTGARSSGWGRRRATLCPIGCGRRVFLESGVVDGPDYETAASLGALNMVSDLREVVLANHLCNDLGLDTISTGVVIAFLNYAAEKGLVSVAPAWGDGERLRSMVESIARRRGLGDVLAEG